MRPVIEVHMGRTNPVELKLTVDDEKLDPTAFTKLELVSTKFTLDSITDPSIFVLSSDKMGVKLGLAALPLGRHFTRLIAYDLQNPQGIVLGDMTLLVRPQVTEDV